MDLRQRIHAVVALRLGYDSKWDQFGIVTSRECVDLPTHTCQGPCMLKYLLCGPLLIVLGLGCGDDSTATCVPGMSVSCPCPGAAGSQACNADGTFGACVCFEPDAGRDGGRDAPIAFDGAQPDADSLPDVLSDTPVDSGPDVFDASLFDGGLTDADLAGACDDGECFFVMDIFSAPSPDPVDGTVVGANLDGEVTGPGDPGGCGKADYTHPDGTMGVDNALSGLLPVIEMGSPTIDEQFATQIANGSTLMTVKLSGVDGMNDPEVIGTLYPTGEIAGGGGAPMLSGGTLSPGQTIDRTSAGLVLNGTIVDGRFEAPLSALPLGVPFGGAAVALTVSQAIFSADITANGLENGEISGSISIVELAIAIATAGVLGIDREAAENLLASFGDLEPNPEGTICARISLSFAFNAIPAVEGREI